jgi:hypothetical protein
MSAVDYVFPSRWFISHVSLVLDDYGVFGVEFGIRITWCKDNDWYLVYAMGLLYGYRRHGTHISRAWCCKTGSLNVGGVHGAWT